MSDTYLVNHDCEDTRFMSQFTKIISITLKTSFCVGLTHPHAGLEKIQRSDVLCGLHTVKMTKRLASLVIMEA